MNIFNPDVTGTFPKEIWGCGCMCLLYPVSPPPLFICIKTLQKLEVFAGRTYLLKYGSKSTIFLEYKIPNNFFLILDCFIL